MAVLCLSICLSVCLSVPYQTLSRERKGVGCLKLEGRKPNDTDDPWSYLEVKRSKVKSLGGY